MTLQVDSLHKCFGYFSPAWIFTPIYLTTHSETGLRSCRCNQTDDRSEAHQGLTAPVRADVGEEPVLNLVPFACAGREVTDGDRESRPLRELLDLPLPQMNARAVAATPVRGDEKRASSRVNGRAHFPPPPLDRTDGEARGVMVYSDRYPTGVASEIVDAVRNRLPLLGDEKVVDPNGFWISSRVPGSPGIPEVPDEFLLLRVDRDHGQSLCLEAADLVVDVAELCIAVGVVRPLASLSIRLQAIACIRKEFRHKLVAD